MPAWFWLNVPLMTVIFTLTVVLPARLVLRDRVAEAAAEALAPYPDPDPSPALSSSPAKELIYS